MLCVDSWGGVVDVGPGSAGASAEKPEQSRAMFAELLLREKQFKAKEIEEKSAVLLGAMVSILTLTRVHPDRKLLESVIEQALLVLD